MKDAPLVRATGLWMKTSGKTGKPYFTGRLGAPNRQPHPRTGGHVILTVSHLNHNKRDDRSANLLTVCNDCHFAYDREENLKKAVATRAAKKAAKPALIPTPSAASPAATSTGA